MSRSTWACELKYAQMRKFEQPDESRSTWACELKFQTKQKMPYEFSHAPRERVSWNEKHLAVNCSEERHAPRERVSWNSDVFAQIGGEGRHAPRERVSWNWQSSSKKWKHARSRSTWACELKFWKARQAERHDVTLHVSVWVEIQILHRVRQRDNASRSTWACELKCLWVEIRRTWFPGHAPRERVSWNPFQTCQHSVECVTLHVSVWVEMTTWKSWQIFSVSHAPRERVSWNAWYVMQIRELQVSRSTWACELKLKNSATQAEPIVSRSTWACELKYVKLWLVSRGFSHAPRERVSWNMFFTRYTFMY